jgi:hypothetical protein
MQMTKFMFSANFHRTIYWISMIRLLMIFVCNLNRRNSEEKTSGYNLFWTNIKLGNKKGWYFGCEKQNIQAFLWFNLFLNVLSSGYNKLRIIWCCEMSLVSIVLNENHPAINYHSQLKSIKL